MVAAPLEQLFRVPGTVLYWKLNRMQHIASIGRFWLNQAWSHKTPILGGILAIVSLSLAHYAGFLMKVPLPIVAVAGMPLAKGVTATFIFYVLFCAVVARVMTSIVQLVFLPFLGATDLLGPGLCKKMNWSTQRRFVRSHSQTIKWEGYLWIVFQAFMLLFLMLATYVKFAITWRSGLALLISVLFVILSGLVRAGFFLQPKPLSFIKKIKTRPARFGRVASAVLVTVTAALVVVAFLMGTMRASLLRDQEPHTIIANDFTGEATIIASSDDGFLLYQKQGEEFRYIYSSPQFTVSVGSKSVFPPIRDEESQAN